MYYCRMGFTCEYLLIANCEFSLCLQLDYLLTSRRRTTVGPHSEQGIHAMQVNYMHVPPTHVNEIHRKRMVYYLYTTPDVLWGFLSKRAHSPPPASPERPVAKFNTDKVNI